MNVNCTYLKVIKSKNLLRFFTDSKEAAFLHKNVGRQIHRPHERPLRLIVIQYRGETAPMPIEKVFAFRRIVERFSRGWGTQERVGEALQRCLEGLVFLSRNVYLHCGVVVEGRRT